MTDLEKAEEYLDKGIEKYQTGNYSAAIVDYNKAIKLNAGFAEAYFHRGNANDELGNHTEAIADYDRASELNPKHIAAYNNRGTAYAHLKQYEKAIEDYDRAIALNPEDATAYYNRGLAKGRRGKHSAAIADFLRLIKHTKDTPDEYNGSRKYLYKYIPINQHQILSLINQELYFSAYQQLNDPLECFFIHHRESEFGQSLKRQKITTRICALTYQPESKLMYSHYADAHQGLCIEYQLDFERLNDEDLISYGNVTYGEKDRFKNLNDLYLLKNTEWEYEEEYRLVRFDNKEFQPAKIISITFAFRCSDDHRKIICTLCKQHSDIHYFEITQKDHTNDLQRVKIPDASQYEVDEQVLFKLMLKHAFQDIYHYFQNHR